MKQFIGELAAEAEAVLALGIDSEAARRLSAWTLSPGEIIRLRGAVEGFDRELAAFGTLPGAGEVRSVQAIRWERLDAVLDSSVHTGSIEDAIKIAERVVKLPPIKSANAILSTEYPPVRWIVGGMIPESGLGLLAASKASGKTWCLLQIACAVASGGMTFGRIKAERAAVLFLELELSERKLRERLDRMRMEEIPGLDIATKWRTADAGVQDIEAAVLAHGYRLVIVDVLARLWPSGANMNDYSDAYSFLGPLREMANRLGVFVLMATHTRKMEAEDAIDQVMGSVGIVGTADVVIGLKRARGAEEAVIRVDGNDVESAEHTVRFIVDPMGFEIVDMDPREAGQSGERRAILDVLRGASAPARTADIAAAVGKNLDATSRLLGKLKKQGLVSSPKYGQWEIPHQSSQSGQGSEQDNEPEFDHFADFDHPSNTSGEGEEE